MNAPTVNPLAEVWKHIKGLSSAYSELMDRVDAVERRAKSLSGLGSGEPRSDIGPVSGYLQDVYNLAPEVLRTEHIRFDLRIENKAIVSQTEPQRIDPEFAFALRRIRVVGWCSDDEVTNFASPDITFNIEDQGRGRGGVFLNPVSIAETADKNGNYAGEIVWDSFYRFVAGASLRGLWTIDPTTLPSTDTYIFTASISGDVLRTRTLPGGALITSQNGTPR